MGSTMLYGSAVDSIGGVTIASGDSRTVDKGYDNVTINMHCTSTTVTVYEITLHAFEDDLGEKVMKQKQEPFYKALYPRRKNR